MDVAELPLDVRHVLGELDVDVSSAGKRERANSIVGGGAGMDRLVLGDGVLDGTRDELLDLPRRGAGPGTEGHRDPDRNVRVFPLRHAAVAEPTPREDADEQNP